MGTQSAATGPLDLLHKQCASDISLGSLLSSLLSFHSHGHSALSIVSASDAVEGLLEQNSGSTIKASNWDWGFLTRFWAMTVNMVGSEVDSLNHSINCWGKLVGSSQVDDDDATLSEAKYDVLVEPPWGFLLELAWKYQTPENPEFEFVPRWFHGMDAEWTQPTNKMVS